MRSCDRAFEPVEMQCRRECNIQLIFDIRNFLPAIANVHNNVSSQVFGEGGQWKYSLYNESCLKIFIQEKYIYFVLC
jgi:hypothetical protein